MTKKLSVEERRRELKNLIAEKGLVEINKSSLGRKFVFKRGNQEVKLDMN